MDSKWILDSVQRMVIMLLFSLFFVLVPVESTFILLQTASHQAGWS